MAEVKNQSSDEHSSSLPSKRKPDLESLKEEPLQDEQNKKNKLEENSDKKIQECDVEQEVEVPISNGKAVDSKGKGIMKEDKGKGKMMVEEEEDGEEEEEDSDSDLRDGVNVSDDEETDLSDDPLAEVDLDNILPSRTRRKIVPPPGAYEVNDLDDDDDDDSDEDENDA